MKMPKFLKPLNMFSLLVMVTGAAFAFRLANIVNFPQLAAEQVGTIMPAGAQEAAPGEEPPPISREDLKKAANETARPAEEEKPVRMAQAGKEETHGEAAKDDSVPPPPDEDEMQGFSASELEVLQSLSRRRAELDARERKIEQREALLTAAGQEVDHKIAELNKLKGEIEALLGKQQKMEEERLASLVKIYENMKPKEAAVIFNTLDLDVLLAIIGRMNERKATLIFQEMDPEKARIVTIRLSEQRKLPPAPAGMQPQKP